MAKPTARRRSNVYDGLATLDRVVGTNVPDTFAFPGEAEIQADGLDAYLKAARKALIDALPAYKPNLKEEYDLEVKSGAIDDAGLPLPSKTAEDALFKRIEISDCINKAAELNRIKHSSLLIENAHDELEAAIADGSDCYRVAAAANRLATLRAQERFLDMFGNDIRWSVLNKGKGGRSRSFTDLDCYRAVASREAAGRTHQQAIGDVATQLSRSDSRISAAYKKGARQNRVISGSNPKGR